MGTAVGGLACLGAEARYRPGDLVLIVDGPARSVAVNKDMRRYRELCRASIGETCRVIYVDGHGRPEADIPEHTVSLFPPATGYSVSLEPGWVALL